MKRAFLVVFLVGILISCTSNEPFSLEVVPGYMESITGQRCVFLVELREDDGSGPVDVTSSVDDAEVVVEYSPVKDDGVAEVTVIPSASALADTVWGDTISGWIKAERGEYRDSLPVTIYVIPGEDGRYEYACQVRDSFVRRLNRDYPNLLIDNSIEWTPTIVRPRILVVSHYLFFSEEWEMWVDWHNTIYPHDWTRMYLRRRGEDMIPCDAFEISSQTEWGDAYEIEHPDSIYR
ncbi:hypothetical protein GF359_02450 [candidate division WOR-3 bacterium]|uniref:Uncharacterized protein n=1 Tax=candidate division WOR-3 bacterium TaxID=2052148 RepID=A0A9D5K8E1_UNCW3|nr:hypothetical protein [candidate division WOR-3 bacterium]MBD3364055.1 hypothetical protein [candidate division WOR-3 bacterium]